MKSPLFLSFQTWLPILISIALSISATATQFKIPRPGVHKQIYLQDSEAAVSPATSDSEKFQTFYYNQTLDHFNYRPESYATFQQRYVINFNNWGGANSSAPIFAYLGAEESIDYDLEGIGFPNDTWFKALIVFIEHRYYGKSIPLGSREEAMKNASTLGYFNSAQALADYAEILIFLKEKLHAKNSPVIVFGGSYGGMLASWFRLKYPHVALGALASSAPILYFDDITPQNGYYSIVSKSFRESSETCFQTIRNSWAEIDKAAAEPNGLSILSKKFKACYSLNSTSQLKNYLDGIYTEAVQYNLRGYDMVNLICGNIDGASEGTNILSRIFAGIVAYRGNTSCYDYTTPDTSETIIGWRWQKCSEMVMPIGRDGMFPAAPFDLDNFIKECEGLYGVPPRPHWVTTYYGGHDIKLILQRFGSNIIFSNGLKDPWSSGGVLENISDTILAVTTHNGSHCLDILLASESDPDWLVKQRQTEADIIEGWINQYYADLQALKE